MAGSSRARRRSIKRSITGESLPVDKTAGRPVFAATIAQAGFLEVEATGVGADTAFGRIVRLVEEAESQKAPVQRFADRFAGLVPAAVLLIVAGATFVITGAVAQRGRGAGGRLRLLDRDRHPGRRPRAASAGPPGGVCSSKAASPWSNWRG